MQQPPPTAFAIAWGLVLIAALPGLGCLALAGLDFATVRAYLDGMSLDGSADVFTPSVHASLRWALVATGGVFLAGALTLALLRRRLAGAVSGQLASARRLAGDVGAGLGRWWREAGPYHLVALGLILLAGAAARIWFLDAPAKYDEACNFIEYAMKSPLVGISYYTAPNNHILHTVLVHLSTSLLGDALWAVRLPAFLAGLVLIPAGYFLFRTIYGDAAGILAAGLMAGSSVLIEFAAAARGYSFMALFYLLLMLVSLYQWRRREPAGWSLWAIIAALGLWTIPSFAFALASVLAWWALSPAPAGTPGGRWPWAGLAAALAGAGALTVLLYTPVLVGSGWRSLLANPYVALEREFPGRWPEVARGLWQVLTRDLPPWLALGLAGLAGLATALHRRLARAGGPLLVAASLGPLALMLIHGKVPPERTWIFLLPVFLGLAGAGLAWLLGRISLGGAAPAGALVLALGLAGLVVAADSPPRSQHNRSFFDGPAVAETIAGRYQPGDGVLTFCPLDEPLAYYFHRRGLSVGSIFLFDRIAESRRVWVVTNRVTGPTLEQLRESARLEEKGFGPPRLVRRFSEGSLYLMERRQP